MVTKTRMMLYVEDIDIVSLFWIENFNAKIKEEIPATATDAVDERAELAKAVGEFFEALQGVEEDEAADETPVEEVTEEIAEDMAEEIAEPIIEEAPVEEVADTEDASVEEASAEETEATEDAPQVEEPVVAEPVQEAPKKKKGFFGRLFG